MQVPADKDVDPDADEHDRDHDREQGGEDRARTQRAGHHRPTTNPTPRTVSISGGSPSFRRRSDTQRSTAFSVAADSLPHTRSSASGRLTTRRRLRNSSSSNAASRPPK